MVSKLDHKVYGPPESKITEELIEREIKGVMTVQEVKFITTYTNIRTSIVYFHVHRANAIVTWEESRGKVTEVPSTNHFPSINGILLNAN